MGFSGGGGSSGWGLTSKQHHLHRPMEKYFSDKEEEKLKKEEEEKMEKIKEKSMEENKIIQLQKIKELIKAEKSKIKLCLLCKRKFANSAHLVKHESLSELHKNNVSNRKKLKT